MTDANIVDNRTTKSLEARASLGALEHKGSLERTSERGFDREPLFGEDERVGERHKQGPLQGDSD